MKKLPLSHILILLLCVIIFQACSTDNSNEKQIQEENTDDYLYFISGKIDEENFLYGLKSDATSIEYSSLFGTSGVCTNDSKSYSGINYSSGVYSYSPDGQSIAFEFVRSYLCSNTQTEVEAFNSAFATKSYTFSNTDDSYSGIDGSIAITYSPNVNNDLYYTSFNGNSINGSFTITKSTEKNQYLLNQLIDVYQEIEGTFSVTLYSVENPQDTITITNGKFKLQVQLL